MKIGDRCTVCESRIDAGEIRYCETCGRSVNEPCEEYETNYECRHCGDETWIGTLEF